MPAASFLLAPHSCWEHSSVEVSNEGKNTKRLKGVFFSGVQHFMKNVTP